MAEDVRHGTKSAGHAIAASIEESRAEIVASYIRRLEEIGSPVIGDPAARAQVITHANQILSDVASSARDGKTRSQNLHLLAWDIGEARAARGIHPRESLRAAEVLFEVTAGALSARFCASEEPLRLLAPAMIALNRSISARIREAVIAYSGFLLGKIHESHLAERNRIARELHDRIGHGISVTHQQLQLYEMYRETEPVKAAARVEVAQEATYEAMQNLRRAISGLRLETPSTGLEKALLTFIEGARAGTVDIRLRVNGDEAWAPAAVRDESYLIVREALLNALKHGKPTVVIVRVDIAPHELRAFVKDNGLGFDPAGDSRPDGIGLSSMRERSELIGGTLQIYSEPTRGTQVELLVPLPGFADV